ncbi:MAG: SsgA family sporulation/cell division regulator, partial [Thermomicrobiales bacterium]
MSKRIISTTTDGGVIATLPMAFVDDARLPLSADFSYRAEDPYAITVVFRTPEQSVSWIFGRELLAEGQSEPAGFGDVQVWPTVTRRGVALTVIELNSPDGIVQVEGVSRDLARFLDATYRLVPTGHEADHLDIDA